MKKLLNPILIVCLLLAFVATGTSVEAGDGDRVTVRLKDGARWRGSVSDTVEVTYLENRNEVLFTGELIKAKDLYLVLRGELAGELREKTIFRDDIVRMRTLGATEMDDDAKLTRRAPKRSERSYDDDAPLDPSGKPLGVFVLPLDGGVGQTFRREEIKLMGEHADTYGPGQIIVLVINSNGGSSLESMYIADEIFEIRKRHRVVAWIKKAISAGCQTAMCCEEIYFMTEGSAGAVTTWMPSMGVSIKGEELAKAMDHLADIAIRSGYSRHVAYAMKTNGAMCSYTRDPDTGEVTFYGDLSGEVVLSDADSNLSFTCSVAEDCGFSKGTADTVEDLAEFLDLPRWHEIDDYGRRIAQKWQDTYKKAEEEIPRLLARRNYLNSSGDRVQRIGTLIGILQDLSRWIDRAPQAAAGFGLAPESKDPIEREIAELRRQIALIRRAERGRGR